MKKLKIFLLAAISILMAACHEKPLEPYVVEVDLSTFQMSGIQVDSLTIVSDTVVCQRVGSLPDYKATLNGEVESPCLADMYVYYSLHGNVGQIVVPVVLENGGTITYNLDNGYANGTPQNDAICDFWNGMKPDSLDTNEYFSRFVEEHKGELSLVAVLSESYIGHYVDAQHIKDALGVLTKEQAELPKIKALSKNIDVQKNK